MGEWIYKATPARRSYEDTRTLALRHHFLARSEFTRTGGRAARVGKVALGDVIHFYYRLPDRTVEALGSFRVTDGSTHPGHFSGLIGGTALVKVSETPENKELVDFLARAPEEPRAQGYKRDPVHHAFTGWAIELLDEQPPRFNPNMLPAPRITLWPYAAPEPVSIGWGRITFDPRVMGGKPCIRGMRVTVGAIVELMAAGHSRAEILRAYPYLEEEDLTEALAYAAWRAQEQELPVPAE